MLNWLLAGSQICGLLVAETRLRVTFALLEREGLKSIVSFFIFAEDKDPARKKSQNSERFSGRHILRLSTSVFQCVLRTVFQFPGASVRSFPPDAGSPS